MLTESVDGKVFGMKVIDNWHENGEQKIQNFIILITFTFSIFGNKNYIPECESCTEIIPLDLANDLRVWKIVKIYFQRQTEICVCTQWAFRCSTDALRAACVHAPCRVCDSSCLTFRHKYSSCLSDLFVEVGVDRLEASKPWKLGTFFRTSGAPLFCPWALWNLTQIFRPGSVD